MAKIDTAELHRIVHGVISDAESFVDAELAQNRQEATKYYFRRPFGDEEEGRSKIVTSDVKDGVTAVIPSIMRLLFGSTSPVEFKADAPEYEQMARNITAYVNYIFTEDNPGFLKTLDVLKDGLVRRLGVFKWFADESVVTEVKEYAGVTEEQLQLLLTEEGAEVEKLEEAGEEAGVPLYRAKILYKRPKNRIVIESVPPEEFLFSRDARDLDSCLMVAHQRLLTRGQLRALGYTDEELERYGQAGGRLTTNAERASRFVTGTSQVTLPEAGPENDEILYTEAYIWLDYDGDGKREQVKVCCLGAEHYPVKHYIVDHRPFAVFVPDPEPHTLVGESWADRLMSVQRLKTAMLRATLDSAAASVFPRIGYLEGLVSTRDILNTEIGAPIRIKREAGTVGNALQPITSPFLAQYMLPLLEYVDQLSDKRTGGRQMAELGTQALQSTTRAAVIAAVSAAQAQIEMLARTFAEMTLKPLFRGILRELIKLGGAARVIKVKSRWLTIDPRDWNADMDVTVNVMLGAGLAEEQLLGTTELVDRQMALLSALGPDNPVVSLVEIRNGLARLAERLGENPETYFRPLDEATFQAYKEQMASQPPPPTPEQILAQAQLEIEKMKTERELAIAEARVTKEREEMQLRDDRERDVAAARIALQLKQLELQYASQINDLQREIAELRAQINASS